MSLPRTTAQTVPAPPSYRAYIDTQPPRYAPAVDTLAYPAPVYSAAAAPYVYGAQLEAGLGAAQSLPAPDAQPAIAQPLSRPAAMATLACVAGAGAAAFVLPAVPGIVMVTLGHTRGNPALQWAGVGWLVLVGLLMAHACVVGARPKTTAERA